MKTEGTGTSFWLLLIGILMIAMGGYVWFHPANAIIALAFYLGVVFLAAGVGYLLSLFSSWSGWSLALGLLNIFVGIIFLGNLGITVASIPIMFAFWALFSGIIRAVASFQLKRAGFPGWFWALISGILGVAFAFLIMSSPLIGVLTITILMGSYMIFYGILAIAEYFALK